MNPSKKILLHALPLAIASALEEQLDPKEYAVETKATNTAYDLVVTADETAAFPGCPVLALKSGRALRLGAILRRMHQILLEPVLYLGDMQIGAHTFRPQEKALLEKDGREIALTDREVDLLACLARHRGETVSREALLKSVWHYQDGLDTHTLETHIYRLRQKMGLSAEDQKVLATDAGGYRLCMDGI